MIDEIDLLELVRRGHEAKAFQDSAPYKDSITQAVTNIVAAFLGADLADEQVLELRRQYISLQAIDNQLSGDVDDGIIAQEELDERTRRTK